MSEEAFEAAFSIVETFVHQNAEIFGPKHVLNIFLMKQAWQRHKIERELAAKKGQSSIRSFFK